MIEYIFSDTGFRLGDIRSTADGAWRAWAVHGTDTALPPGKVHRLLGKFATRAAALGAFHKFRESRVQ